MVSSNRVFIPMELCDGDLFGHLSAKGPVPIDGPSGGLHAKDLARQLLSALHYCHSRSIYHGDVKPENVMLLGNVAKLGDFGSAGTSPVRDALVGTLEYSPPETIMMDNMSSPSGAAPRVLRHGLPPYASAPADVFSFGVCACMRACLCIFSRMYSRACKFAWLRVRAR